MADLTTEYMGLTLKNPVMVSSCGLTETASGVQKAEDAGAGAVVMKSVFEEQINAEVEALAAQSIQAHPEWQDYLGVFGKEDSLRHYLEEIRKAKAKVSIPVFGSVNCVSAGGWTDFVKRLEATGIDGLELNVFVVPSDLSLSSEDIENTYLEIFNRVKSLVFVPVVLKLPPYITTPGRFVRRLVGAGVQGFVLYNRPVPFDVDIAKQQIAVKNVLSAPEELSFSLRMMSILAGQYRCHLAASTGVHDGEAVIKHLLVGTDVVQLCSALYKNGFRYIRQVLDEVNDWLDAEGIASVNDIRGKLCQQNTANQAIHERVQYIKAFANIK